MKKFFKKFLLLDVLITASIFLFDYYPDQKLNNFDLTEINQKNEIIKNGTFVLSQN